MHYYYGFVGGDNMSHVSGVDTIKEDDDEGVGICETDRIKASQN